MKDNKVLISSYGSLRLGEYNYNRFKQLFGEDFNYVKTSSIAGFNLYDLGSYPGLKIARSNEDKVIVDILEVSQKCFDYIESMEHGAGYSTIQVTDELGDKYLAYLYEHSCNNLVESGDWSKYLKIGQAV